MTNEQIIARLEGQLAERGRAEDWMRRGLAALERAEKAEDEAAALLAGYLRLQEAVVEHTRSLPMVRARILAVCDPEGAGV